MKRGAFVVLVGCAILGTSLPSGVSGQDGPIAAEIRAGTCERPGPAVARLQPPVLPDGERAGSDAAVSAATSVTPAALPLDALLTADRVVTLSSDGAVVACGAIGGQVGGDGSLAIALRPTGDGDASGVASFTAAGDVSLFVDPGSIPMVRLRAADASTSGSEPAAERPARDRGRRARAAQPAQPPAATVDSPTAAVSADPGTRENPLPIGTAADVGGGWVASVVGVTPDATREILATNQFNDPPPDGSQFFMVEVSATYAGERSSQFLADLAFSLVGESAVAYGTLSPSCGVIPDEFSSTEVFTGGTVRGNICFVVRSADADSVVMYSEDYVGFDPDKRAWFAVR